MPPIVTELDRLMDEWSARARQVDQRSRLSRGVFEAHKRRMLDDPDIHPLRYHRLTFRDEGITVSDLSSRALVGESTITEIESRKNTGSDLTWSRLCRALGVRRAEIDPNYVYTS